MILGTYGISTKSFANQVNLSMPNCWAILKNTIDRIYYDQKPTGDYVFMKDPAKAMMKLYLRTSDELDDEIKDDEL